MSALCLRQVNCRQGIGKEQPHEDIAEDCGALLNSDLEGGIAIMHEWSPSKTTHNDFRLAVNALSGGDVGAAFLRAR